VRLSFQKTPNRDAADQQRQDEANRMEFHVKLQQIAALPELSLGVVEYRRPSS
jgi:hypothetical protein